MKMHCPICSVEFEFFSLDPIGGNERQFLQQEYYQHLNECLRNGDGRNGLPSANPSPKHGDLRLSNDIPSADEDYLSAMVRRVGDERLREFLRSLASYWGYYDRGSVYAYLTDIRRYSGTMVAEGFGVRNEVVRLAKKRALDNYRRDAGTSCMCHISKVVLQSSIRSCPHEVGFCLFTKSTRDLWRLIEGYCWHAEKS